MASKFKRILVIAGLISATLIPPANAINQGDKCDQVGQTKKINGVTWRCIGTPGNFYWDEKLTFGYVSVFPGQVIEGFRDIATGQTKLVPTVLMARLGRVGIQYTWSIPISAQLPKNFKREFLSRYGVVSGTADIAAGQYWIEFKVQDTALTPSSWSSKFIKLNITECNSVFSIEEGAVNSLCPEIVLNFPKPSNYMITGKKNQPYAISLGAYGGLPPYKWQLIGVKPLGMWFDNNTGVLHGTPKQAKTNIFNVKITDKAGAWKEQQVRFIVTK